MYYSNTNDDPASNAVDVGASDPTSERDLQVVATQPTYDPTDATSGTGPSTATQHKDIRTASPVAGEIVAVYAMDSLGYNATTRDWRVHSGVDIAADEGTAVCAAADGTVYTVYEDETMGTTVVIRHVDGYVTTYASLSEDVSVKAGDSVAMGQKIGCVGQTALLESAIGCHVHFGVTCNDEPVDPQEFLAQE